jgi:hypothetical protein
MHAKTNIHSDSQSANHEFTTIDIPIQHHVTLRLLLKNIFFGEQR